MTERPFKFDEIGYWSELKLEIVEKYGAAYTKAFAHFPNLKKYYIDGFSGAGMHLSKTTGAPIEGSPARALKVRPLSTASVSSTSTPTRPIICDRSAAPGRTSTSTPAIRTPIC